jgi:dolichol-phosphate mannosyltransferase
MQSLIIIPTYNEHENLLRLIPALLGVDPYLEVLVIDDGSPDGTGEIAESFALRTDRVRVLHRKGKLGLGTAYVAGFEYALSHDYAYVLQMDADFSHRPEDLPRLLRAVESADVVIGSRNVPGGRVEDWSLLRRFISKGDSFYARTLLNLPIRDCTSGFKCFRREVLEANVFGNVKSNGYGFQVEINHLCHRAGFRIVEVPIVFPDRGAGRSKMSWRIFLEAAMLVWKLRHQTRPRFGKPLEQAARPEITLDSAMKPERALDRWTGREPPNETVTLKGSLLKRVLSGHGRRFLRFGSVGASGVLVNHTFLYVLTGVIGLNHLMVAAVATEAAILNDFTFNNLWTFGDVQLRAGGLVISVAVSAILIYLLHILYLVANLVAIGAAMLWNYSTSHYWTWRAASLIEDTRTVVKEEVTK